LYDGRRIYLIAWEFNSPETARRGVRMEHQPMRLSVSISCAAALLACGAIGDPAAAQHGPAPAADINAFLDRWHHAAAVADETAYFAAMDSGAVYLGTDPGERWSKQAFHEWARPQFASGSAWAFTPVGRQVTVAPSGDIAWFDEKLKWFDTRLNAWMGGLRGSGVVRHTPDGWRIEQYNLTMELPNDRLGDVVHLLRVSQAVEPADRREIAATVRELLRAPATLDSSVRAVIVTPWDSAGSRAAWMARTARDSTPEMTLLGDGTVAAAWAPFITFEGAQRTGCGLAQLQLLKLGSSWRITSLAVHQRERCPEAVKPED
jgi:SnoaL-like domain